MMEDLIKKLRDYAEVYELTDNKEAHEYELMMAAADAIESLRPIRADQEGCEFCRCHEEGDTLYESSDWDGGIGFDYIRDIKYCPVCGRKLCGEEDEEPVKEDIIKDCRTCGYGHYNDHWGQNLCYDPRTTGSTCVEWSHWIPKEET